MSQCVTDAGVFRQSATCLQELTKKLVLQNAVCDEVVLVACNHLALPALLPALLLYSRIRASLLIYDEMVVVAEVVKQVVKQGVKQVVKQDVCILL